MAKTIRYFFIALTIGIIIFELTSCYPAYYTQMKDKVKLEVTHTDGLRDYFIVHRTYTLTDSCIVSEGRKIACEVIKYKEL